jgi:hypothetical protein
MPPIAQIAMWWFVAWVGTLMVVQFLVWLVGGDKD